MKTNSQPTERTTGSIAPTRRERARNATILVLASLFVVSYVVLGPINPANFITSIHRLLQPRALNMPAGLALDVHSNLYVVDSENDRVVEFSPDGQLIRTWSTQGTGPGQFDHPHAITVDAQGNVYVTEEAGDASTTGQAGRVEKFDAQGRFLLQWKVDEPTGIAVDRSATVYVATLTQVQKYSPTGSLLQMWDTPRGDQKAAESAIAIDGGDHIYVTCDLADGATVTQFGIDGQLVRSWSTKFSDVANVHHVIGIGVDGHGSVYVADQTKSTILKFRDTGTFVGTLGRDDSDSNALFPWGITVDGSGLIYVSDMTTNHVQQLSTTGDRLRTFGQ